jgi:predicted CXXCH cytochrome family protein
MFVIRVLPGLIRTVLVAILFCIPATGYTAHDVKMPSFLDDSHDSKVPVCPICHLSTVRKKSCVVPLWNPTAVCGDFLLVQHATENVLNTPSLLCLSCHDNATAPAPPTSEGWFERLPLLGAQVTSLSPEKEIGHHPFRVEYPGPGSPDSQRYFASPMCELPLFALYRSGPGVNLECPTCHDPHSPAGEPYLRVSSEQHKLCLCCHRELPQLTRQVYLPMQKEKRVIKSGDCHSCHNK